MKICLVAPVPPPYGGIANWTKMMGEYVKERQDVSMTFVNTAPAKRGMEGRTLWDRVVVQGFEMLRVNKHFKKLLCEDKYDAVHMTTSAQLAIIRDILMLKTAKKPGVPTVYHIRFGRIPDIAQRNTAEWKMLKTAMQLASLVMVIDKASLEAVKRYAPKVNVCYVPNPLDMNKLCGIEINPKVKNKEIVFVGWVIKTKGVGELLSAWESLCEKYPDYTLKIVGPVSEEYKKELMAGCSCKNAVFAGEMDNKKALKTVAEGEIFVLPSYTEGFPNAVLEAMALEKPIIATSVGAIPDMLDGCGIVIEPQSADAIEAALDRLLSDEALRESLAKAAREKMLAEYTMEKVFDTYVSTWKNL